MDGVAEEDRRDEPQLVHAGKGDQLLVEQLHLGEQAIAMLKTSAPCAMRRPYFVVFAYSSSVCSRT